MVWIDGLSEALLECFAAGLLPAERGIAWARAGRSHRRD